MRSGINAGWFFSTEDDKGRQKKLVNLMLINAESVKQAYERLEVSLKTILMPYEITDINRTPILDIFPYEENGEGNSDA